jgi:hypothetical protein
VEEAVEDNDHSAISETDPESIVATGTTNISKEPNAKPARRRQARTTKSSLSSTKNRRIKASITKQDTSENQWKDVKDWTDLDNGTFEYVLNFDSCKANSFFLMFCTAVTDQSEDERPFLFLGKIVSVDNKARTFTYKRMDSIRPANQYDKSCLSGTSLEKKK